MLRTINRARGREAMDTIGKGGKEAKKRKEPQGSCRRYVGNGGGMGGKRGKRRQEIAGLVAVDPDNLRIARKQGGERSIFRA